MDQVIRKTMVASEFLWCESVCHSLSARWNIGYVQDELLVWIAVLTHHVLVHNFQNM